MEAWPFVGWARNRWLALGQGRPSSTTHDGGAVPRRGLRRLNPENLEWRSRRLLIKPNLVSFNHLDDRGQPRRSAARSFGRLLSILIERRDRSLVEDSTSWA